MSTGRVERRYALRLVKQRLDPERLLVLHDASLLEQSLEAAAGALVRPPRSKQDRPDRDRLAIRFEHFKRAA